MRNQTAILACIAIVMAIPTLAEAAVGYDVYIAGVPDLDKPNPADNSCWLGSAANVLAGGGWNSGNATGIYNDLTAHFGTNNPGWSSVAINWWLLNHGYNPDSADYSPTQTYNNVTLWKYRLTEVDYDNLLNVELTGGQYVNVSFDIPGQDVGHEMTLVGGDFSATPGGVSVWHDSNGDLSNPPGDDDEYTNTWIGQPPRYWNIDRNNTPDITGDDWEAAGATILCPGLQKPDLVMQNFDVAYFKDMDSNTGSLYNNFRHAGTSYGQDAGDYTGPAGQPEAYWIDSGQWADPNRPELIVPNIIIEEKHKEIWLLVDFVDRNIAADPDIIIADDDGTEYTPDSVEWTTDQGQALLHWILPDQPDWEKVIFPEQTYFDLYDISAGSGGPVKDWNLATICIPEPATLALLTLGAMTVLRRKRR